MYHNPRLFKDPEVLVPERWLGDPRYDNDKRDAVQPFSVGPRNCVGKKWVSFVISAAQVMLPYLPLIYVVDAASPTPKCALSWQR